MRERREFINFGAFHKRALADSKATEAEKEFARKEIKRVEELVINVEAAPNHRYEMNKFIANGPAYTMPDFLLIGSVDGALLCIKLLGDEGRNALVGALTPILVNGDWISSWPRPVFRHFIRVVRDSGSRGSWMRPVLLDGTVGPFGDGADIGPRLLLPLLMKGSCILSWSRGADSYDTPPGRGCHDFVRVVAEYLIGRGDFATVAWYPGCADIAHPPAWDELARVMYERVVELAISDDAIRGSLELGIPPGAIQVSSAEQLDLVAGVTDTPWPQQHCRGWPDIHILRSDIIGACMMSDMNLDPRMNDEQVTTREIFSPGHGYSSGLWDIRRPSGICFGMRSGDGVEIAMESGISPEWIKGYLFWSPVNQNSRKMVPSIVSAGCEVTDDVMRQVYQLSVKPGDLALLIEFGGNMEVVIEDNQPLIVQAIKDGKWGVCMDLLGSGIDIQDRIVLTVAELVRTFAALSDERLASRCLELLQDRESRDAASAPAALVAEDGGDGRIVRGRASAHLPSGGLGRGNWTVGAFSLMLGIITDMSPKPVLVAPQVVSVPQAVHLFPMLHQAALTLGVTSVLAVEQDGHVVALVVSPDGRVGYLDSENQLPSEQIRSAVDGIGSVTLVDGPVQQHSDTCGELLLGRVATALGVPLGPPEFCADVLSSMWAARLCGTSLCAVKPAGTFETTDGASLVLRLTPVEPAPVFASLAGLQAYLMDQVQHLLERIVPDFQTDAQQTALAYLIDALEYVGTHHDAIPYFPGGGQPGDDWPGGGGGYASDQNGKALDQSNAHSLPGENATNTTLEPIGLYI